MRSTHKVLSLLLALLLALSNMAFSAHVSSHSATESGLCSLCVHPGGPDTAITHEPGAFFVTSTAFSLTSDHVPTPVLPVILHVHQSRAPPSLT
jgi:hypothetical protein